MGVIGCHYIIWNVLCQDVQIQNKFLIGRYLISALISKWYFAASNFILFWFLLIIQFWYWFIFKSLLFTTPYMNEVYYTLSSALENVSENEERRRQKGEMVDKNKSTLKWSSKMCCKINNPTTHQLSNINFIWSEDFKILVVP